MVFNTDSANFVADFDFSPFDDYMLATGAQDNSLKVWLLPQESERENVNHGDQVQNMSWRTSGALMSTTCRDKQMRILDLRANQVVQKVPGHQSVKDTRIQWLGDTDYIVSTGFAASYRDFHADLYPDTAGGEPALTASQWFSGQDGQVTKVPLLSKPGRLGDTADELPTIQNGSKMCDFVWDPFDDCRLVVGHMEKIYFVRFHPLVKDILMSSSYDMTVRMWNLDTRKAQVLMVPVTEYFQDDLYPDTLVTWEPALTAAEWLGGQDTNPRRVSLCPAGMEPVSQAPVEAPKPKKFESFNPDTFKSDEQKKDEDD
nr:hypothetical protein BaRGS_019516 [Batillaria attramentaria]